MAGQTSAPWMDAAAWLATGGGEEPLNFSRGLMFAINLFGIVFVAALSALVSSEVYAALHAAHFAKKEGGGWRVAMARYQWASAVFHELASVDAGRKAAYRASYVGGVWLAVAAALTLSVNAPFIVELGVATLAAAGFGGVAYGKAFLQHRVAVRKEIEAWMALA